MKAQYRFYWITLFAIILTGVFVRLLGVLWLTEAVPYTGYSFHPDDLRFIKEVESFIDSDPWRGYVRGMTTHLFVVMKVLDKITGVHWDPSIVIRLISVFYGACTILLVAFMVRSWSYSPKIALTTAILLAIAPLHVINSHFGTSDVVATFYFYLALLLGWLYMKTGRPLLFVSFAVAVGACIAFKFFLALLVPLAVVIWLEGKGRRLDKIITAFFTVVASFSIFNFFNYTPWHFLSLLDMLMFDNMWVPDGETPAGNLVLYMWEMMSSLGLGMWVFFMVGVVIMVARLIADVKAKIVQGRWTSAGLEAVKSPNVVLWSAFLAHAFLILSPDLHAVRHLVAFIPLACFIAAFGFWELTRRLNMSTIAVSALLALLLAYQLYNVVKVEGMYRNDLRNGIAAWIKENVAPGEIAATHKNAYATVAGVQVIKDIESKMGDSAAAEPHYFVTCDLGYARFFESTDAREVFHSFGGQVRLDFYRDLFAGKLNYDVALDLVQEPNSLEQWLQEEGFLLSLESFTPRRCVIFKRVELDEEGSMVRENSE